MMKAVKPAKRASKPVLAAASAASASLDRPSGGSRSDGIAPSVSGLRPSGSSRS